MTSAVHSSEQDVKQAANYFNAAQLHYAQGNYEKAIEGFLKAHELSPHASALFNIARCQENLGKAASAIDYYKKALDLSNKSDEKADIQARLNRLLYLPVKIFLSTEPTGASVFVDGVEPASPQQTPTVLELKPGGHVLLIKHPGYEVSARSIMVRPGQEQTIIHKLRPQDPTSKICASPPSTQCPPCAETRLVDSQALHVHASAFGGFALIEGHPIAGGPGAQLYATYRRILLGGHFLFFPIGESKVSPITMGQGVDALKFTKSQQRWVMGQFEGGYVFPFRTAYVFTSLGIGASADRVVFSDEGRFSNSYLVKEEYSFVSSVGSGLEVMANSWLSVGAAIRVGLGVGGRADPENPNSTGEQSMYPFGTLWGTLTFHL